MPIKKESEKVNLDSITDDYILPNNAILESKINVKNSKQRFSGKVILAVAFGLMAILGLLMIINVGSESFRNQSLVDFRIDWLNATIAEQLEFVNQSEISNLSSYVFTPEEQGAAMIIKEYGVGFGNDGATLKDGYYRFNPITGEINNSADSFDEPWIMYDEVKVLTAYESAFDKATVYGIYAQDKAFELYTFRGWTRLIVGLSLSVMFGLFLAPNTRRTTERAASILVLVLAILVLIYAIYRFSFVDNFVYKDHLRDSIITTALIITGSMLVLEGISSEAEDINNKILRKPSGNE